jgi:hypothetical protein
MLEIVPGSDLPRLINCEHCAVREGDMRFQRPDRAEPERFPHRCRSWPPLSHLRWNDGQDRRGIVAAKVILAFGNVSRST